MAARLKNVTITLDERTASWLRVTAARRGLSVSRFVGEILRGQMNDQKEYLEAMQHYLSLKPFKFEWVDGRPPTREELYDRSRVR